MLQFGFVVLLFLGLYITAGKCITTTNNNISQEIWDTCPCVRPNTSGGSGGSGGSGSGGGDCFPYDTNYQAASLQEAVVNFYDLTIPDPAQAKNIYDAKPIINAQSISFEGGLKKADPALRCNTLECLACFQVLTERLTTGWHELGQSTAGLGLGLSNLSPLSVDGALNTNLAQRCKRLFPQQPQPQPQPKPKPQPQPQQRIRTKRASATKSVSANEAISTQLDCSFKRGDPVGDNSGYVGLCNLCWSMRTLSAKYFPRYVNELSCHHKDKSCLNGWGKCRERYRSVDVLYNYGTDAKPKWQQYSINSPVACECQILAGSELHNFINKSSSSS